MSRKRTREDMLKPLTENRSLGKALDDVETAHREFLNRVFKLGEQSAAPEGTQP